MEDKEEEKPTVFLERSSRATRGRRLMALVDEEMEADEQFWGQDAFKEDAGDNEYEAEEEVIDEFDSDFDEDETNVEEEAPDEDVERVKRKRTLPPGTQKPKEKKKGTISKLKGLEAIEAAVAAAAYNDDSETVLTSISTRQPAETSEANEDLENEKTVRKSMRTAVVIRQAERDALRAAMQATIRPVKRKREGERRITQEDMLLEAAQTEIMNRQNLERMLAREEEVKQKAIVHKTVYNGPRIRFYSRDGKNYLEFLGAQTVARRFFNQPKPRLRQQVVCVVTGMPAKYIDPLTELPYATTEAFKIIRQSVDRLSQDGGMGTLKTSWKRQRSGRLSMKANGLKLGASRLRDILESSPDYLKVQLASLQTGGTPSTREFKSHALSPAHLPSKLSCSGKEILKSSIIPAKSQASLEARTPGSSNVPVWVDIPPPIEVPNEEDFKLDDLTSLTFGPLLTVQHEFSVDDCGRDHDELDLMQSSSVDTMLSLDTIPIPDFMDEV